MVLMTDFKVSYILFVAFAAMAASGFLVDEQLLFPALLLVPFVVIAFSAESAANKGGCENSL